MLVVFDVCFVWHSGFVNLLLDTVSAQFFRDSMREVKWGFPQFLLDEELDVCDVLSANKVCCHFIVQFSYCIAGTGIWYVELALLCTPVIITENRISSLYSFAAFYCLYIQKTTQTTKPRHNTTTPLDSQPSQNKSICF